MAIRAAPRCSRVRTPSHPAPRPGMMLPMSAERVPYTDTYAPMPALGTIRECVFCRFMVTLREVRSGWRHWTADRDPLDGRWHCDGGEPGNAHSPAIRTLHVPLGADGALPFAPRYDTAGHPHHPQDHSARRRLA